MFDFGKASLKTKDGQWVDLGEVTAMCMTLSNGKKIYSGKPEGIFNLRCTEEDKELLKEMKIGE